MRTSLFLTLFLPSFLAAQQPQRLHDITLPDYFTQADIFQIALAPDGKHVAYTEGRWQESTDDRKTDLWVVDCVTKKERRLTSDRSSARSPQWNGDGTAIFFLANRKRDEEKLPPYNGKTQIWRVNLAGGEPEAVTSVEEGIAAFQLGHGGDFVYYQINSEVNRGDWAQLQGKFNKLEYGHGVDKVSVLWKLAIGNERAEKIVDAKRFIHEFKLSDDEKHIAMITAPDEKVVSFEGRSRVDVFHAATKRIDTVPDKIFRVDAPSPYAWLQDLAWSPRGRFLAFNTAFDGYPAEIIVVDFAKEQPAVSRLPRPGNLSIRGYGSPVYWRDDNTLWFLGEEKARVRLCQAEGWTDGTVKLVTVTPGDVVVEGLSGAGKRVAFIMATPSQFPDIYLLESSGPQRLTRVNPQTDSWKLPSLSIVRWKGAHDQAVEGVLELPPGYKAGDKLPLVAVIHGGPTTAVYYKLQYWIYGRTLLAAKGYAVLCPNYRGSTGYGDKFLTDLIGHENQIEVQDILAGVDDLVAKGIADPDKLAVSGWSNGGYLTNCLITHTPRFKAAISGAGIVDSIMEWGANDEPAYAMVFKQGLPWTNPEKYHRGSPIYQIGKVRTPTLIHVGGSDDRCPPGQSRMLFRALHEYLHVPTQLVVYPGEGHGIMKYKSRQAKLEWDLAWLERYILGKRK